MADFNYNDLFTINADLSPVNNPTGTDVILQPDEYIIRGIVDNSGTVFNPGVDFDLGREGIQITDLPTLSTLYNGAVRGHIDSKNGNIAYVDVNESEIGKQNVKAIAVKVKNDPLGDTDYLITDKNKLQKIRDAKAIHKAVNTYKVQNPDWNTPEVEVNPSTQYSVEKNNIVTIHINGIAHKLSDQESKDLGLTGKKIQISPLILQKVKNVYALVPQTVDDAKRLITQDSLLRRKESMISLSPDEGLEEFHQIPITQASFEAQGLFFNANKPIEFEKTATGYLTILKSRSGDILTLIPYDSGIEGVISNQTGRTILQYNPNLEDVVVKARGASKTLKLAAQNMLDMMKDPVYVKDLQDYIRDSNRIGKMSLNTNINKYYTNQIKLKELYPFLNDKQIRKLIMELPVNPKVSREIIRDGTILNYNIETQDYAVKSGYARRKIADIIGRRLPTFTRDAGISSSQRANAVDDLVQVLSSRGNISYNDLDPRSQSVISITDFDKLKALNEKTGLVLSKLYEMVNEHDIPENFVEVVKNYVKTNTTQLPKYASRAEKWKREFAIDKVPEISRDEYNKNLDIRLGNTAAGENIDTEDQTTDEDSKIDDLLSNLENQAAANARRITKAMEGKIGPEVAENNTYMAARALVISGQFNALRSYPTKTYIFKSNITSKLMTLLKLPTVDRWLFTSTNGLQRIGGNNFVTAFTITEIRKGAIPEYYYLARVADGKYYVARLDRRKVIRAFDKLQKSRDIETFVIHNIGKYTSQEWKQIRKAQIDSYLGDQLTYNKLSDKLKKAFDVQQDQNFSAVPILNSNKQQQNTNNGGGSEVNVPKIEPIGKSPWKKIVPAVGALAATLGLGGLVYSQQRERDKALKAQGVPFWKRVQILRSHMKEDQQPAIKVMQGFRNINQMNNN